MGKNVRSAIESFFQKYWMIIAIAAVFVVLRIVTTQHDAIPAWDGAVYVGMGKYLYSHGTVGTWEALRPIGLPIILGAFWKAGIDPYGAGTVISLVISTALIILTYVFAERIRPASGAIAATLLAGTAVFFNLSAVPVTDIISTFFALSALYVLYRANTNPKYFAGGVLAALAFMFRFPQGLLLVAAMIVILIKMMYEKGKWDDKFSRCIERGFVIGGGFVLIVVPYLVSNYISYHNAFLPFIEGTAVIKQYPSLYQKGIWFYLLEALKQDPLFIFAFVPVGLLFIKKQRSVGIFVLISTLVLVAGYFTLEVHKETRYMIAFLPYMAILAGIGIVYVLERFKLPQLLFFGLFGIAAFMANAALIVHPPHNPDNVSMHDFESYLRKAPHARVLSTTPDIFVYTDTLLVRNLYSDWNDAYMAYSTLKGDTDYILLNSCGLETGCADNAHCKDDKQLLLDTLALHDTEVFSTTTPSQCVVSIYKIAH